eukprot:1153844-Pelagomonas_calceolata.AAC.7
MALWRLGSWLFRARTSSKARARWARGKLYQTWRTDLRCWWGHWQQGNVIAVLVALVSRVAKYLRMLEAGAVGFEDGGGQQYVINAAVCVTP